MLVKILAVAIIILMSVFIVTLYKVGEELNYWGKK